MTEITLDDDIKAAIDVLNKGGLILYPTDTIWGLGCDATNPEAVEKIYKLKQRSDSKALIVMIDTMAKLNYFVEEVPDIAFDFIELSTKPMTIIYDNGRNVAENLLSDDGSLAIRVSEERFSKTLCARLKKPLVSTSANISGQPSPRFFDEISDEIKSQVDYIVKYRQEDKTPSLPSSIIKVSRGGQTKVIRE